MLNKTTMRINFLLIVLLSMHSSLISWENWNRAHACKGEVICPQTKTELMALVQNASSQNQKIRVIGSGHSGNDIACSDDLLISLENLNQILSVDLELKQVKFQAGITLGRLNSLIAQQDLALPNLISVTEPTFAGAMATGSHGTGHTGSLASFVLEIELITADGHLLQLSSQNDPMAYHAACVNLGTLGVVYSITVQCEPLFKLQYHNFEISIDDLVLRSKAFYEQNDYFQFRWDTSTEIVTVEFWNRVPIGTPLSASIHYSFDTLPCDQGMPYISETKNGKTASEMAIPVQFLPEAIGVLRECIPKWKSQGFTIPHFIGRFVKIDTDLFLSPAGCDVLFLGMNRF